MTTSPAFSDDAIRDVVLVAHGDLAKLQSLLADEPGLLNVTYEPWNETPLGAASHVGNRRIAQYLLDQGAPLTICTAAMMGMGDAVRAFIEADPAAASARGAHGIPVLTHAGFSGDITIADMLLTHGDGAGLDGALHAAIARGHQSLVAWLLERGASVTAADWQGKTAAELADEQGNPVIIDLIGRYTATG